MAKLILTGEIEAIDLKHLHGKQLLKLDTIAAEKTATNGGFARFVLQLKRGIFDLVEVCELISIHPEKPMPRA